jgi:hypothetical protein
VIPRVPFILSFFFNPPLVGNLQFRFPGSEILESEILGGCASSTLPLPHSCRDNPANRIQGFCMAAVSRAPKFLEVSRARAFARSRRCARTWTPGRLLARSFCTGALITREPGAATCTHVLVHA